MTAPPPHTLLTDLLSLLRVPYTEEYSRKRFDQMPFKSLFGLQKLLAEYKVDSVGLRLPSPSYMRSLQTPFIAVTKKGMVIVTHIGEDRVEYMSRGEMEQIPISEFNGVVTGEVFVAMPQADAREPDFTAHETTRVVSRLRDVALVVGAVALFAYLFVSNRLYANVSQCLVALFDCLGLYLTFLLMQKSLNFSNSHADRICKVLQEGGCDDILKMSASKVFGVFSWSEVGFTYFSVSLLTLLVFPQFTPYLCLLNACCLPYTIWSIWYQRFRAHKWCTLCVSVQCTLWLLFFSYLIGGWWSRVFPLRLQFWVLVVAYGTVLMALSKLFPLLYKSEE